MKISTKFDINQKVYIDELKLYGKIKSIFVTRSSTEYNVRYFDSGKPLEVYFLEDEISLEQKKELGFS
jgi:hypothetical protein